jgi:hypothetical protein
MQESSVHDWLNALVNNSMPKHVKLTRNDMKEKNIVPTNLGQMRIGLVKKKSVKYSYELIASREDERLYLDFFEVPSVQ